MTDPDVEPQTDIYVKFDEETIDKMLEHEDIANLHLRAAKRAFMRLDGRMKPLEKPWTAETSDPRVRKEDEDV